MATTMEQVKCKDIAPPPAAADAPAAREVYLIPAVDVLEGPQGITLYADMPGVDRSGLTVEVEGDTLLIEGRGPLSLPEGARPVHAEQRAVNFRRRFTLSGDLQRDNIDATLAHGVLTLRIPKTEAAWPRRIAVRSG